MLEVRRLSRAEVEAAFDDLARLRIRVFRDFPYLYDGDFDYERHYLETYIRSPNSVVIGALQGDSLVGAATASPLTDHFDEFAAPFISHGLKPEEYFYFGESVLQREWRGKGIGVRFFEEREKAARDAGFSLCVFSAVIRPSNHPERPSTYQPLDKFWANRGYKRIDGLQTGFSWRDIGQADETTKPMEYWEKQLSTSTKLNLT